MWVMNTSTTIMLLPIGLAVVSVVKETVKDLTEDEADNFQLALLLGIAYGATIGGMSTLIGTGPNGILAAFMAIKAAKIPLGPVPIRVDIPPMVAP